MDTTVSPAPAGPRAGDSRLGQPLISCQNLARTFGLGTRAVVAVHAVTLTVPSRTRAALTGPSGSGKSTLLHMFGGLDSPTGGTLSWPGLGGHPLAEPGRVGMIFQGPSLLPALTVTENVALPLQLAGSSTAAATEIAGEALDTLGIAELAASLPEQISGGQAQRVAIARALVGKPSLILADEPTGQLDHATAALVLDVLMHACDELGAALIVSTHDPIIAARLPQQWAMSDGTLAPTLSSTPSGGPA